MRNCISSRIKLESFVATSAFIAFFIFICWSNLFDWDTFLSSFESDRRSWIFDLTPPTWSYQLCAGVTRIGDPQGFGLSPLFVFPLIFGSYWGLKILILFSILVGFYYSRQILILLAENRDSENIRGSATLVSLMFVLGNYFVWHLHHGHITFVLYFFSLGIVFYPLKTKDGSISTRDTIKCNILTWTVFSAGFYPASVYFLLPLLLTLLLYICLDARNRLSTLIGLSKLALPGFLIASYKWVPTLIYQIQNPRTVSDSPVIEIGTPLKTFVYQFLPTYYYAYVRKFLSSDIEGGVSHGIWEYSAFSVLNWLFVILCIVSIKNRNVVTTIAKSLKSFILLYFVVVFLFVLGDASPFLPYPILNKLLKGSVRVIGRYQIGITAVIALSTWLLLISNGLEKYRRSLALLTCLSIVNLLTFGSTQAMGRLPDDESEGKMRFVKLVRPPDRHQSYMYESILKGFAVANCYNPLTRTRNFSSNFTLAQMAAEPQFIFVNAPEDSECAKKSYFTQSKVFLDSSCPAETTLKFNALKNGSQP